VLKAASSMDRSHAEASAKSAGGEL
jgi:hypothetical protein